MGAGGWGAEKQSKGRVGRRQGRQAPRRVPQRRGRTAAKQSRHPPPGTTAAGQDGGKAGKPPAGYHSGKAGRRQERQAPRRAHGSPPCSSAARVQPRECKGRSPLHKITLSPPFPPGRGSGGYPSPSGKGGKNKAKGRVDGRQGRQAPAGRTVRPPAPVPPGFSPGDARGEAPCIK